MGRPCQMAKKGATQCHEGLEEIDVLLHLSQCMRCVQMDTQMKRNPNRTHQSNQKPKSDPFVISIGSPESDGKERYPMSSGDRD